MATTKITRKGQVTIPADIRRKLGIQEGDIFTVHEQNGQVVLESQSRELRLTSEAVARHAQRLPPLEPYQIRELAARYMAEEVMQSMYIDEENA